MKRQNHHFSTWQYSNKRRFPCINVVSFRSRLTIFFPQGRQVAKLVGAQGKLVHPFTKKKGKRYRVTFSNMFRNIRCNQHLLPFTFWKVGLFAVVKWLLSPSLRVPTGLCINLPPLSKNDKWLTGGQGKGKPIDLTRVTIEISCGSFTLASVTNMLNTDKNSKFGALDLNCRLTDLYSCLHTALLSPSGGRSWWRLC